MSWIWPILAMLFFVFWTVAVIDIIRRRHAMSGVGIAAWLIAILVFPIVGTIAYFLVRRVSGAAGAPESPEMGDRSPGA